MKIATILGARPQFVKAVFVSKMLRKKHHEIIIHTGQHYDKEMSEVFFHQLNIPEPDYNLEVGSGTPNWQVGTMMLKLEEVLSSSKPDIILVYGDTNTTLAGALTASKMNILLAHIEAGLRSFHPTMQEEKNRVVTDHLSQLLFCPTSTAVKNLKREGIREGVHQVGDVMVDTLSHFLPIAEKSSQVLEKMSLTSKSYFLATVHRAENTDNPKKLTEIFQAFSIFPESILLPLHPRTKKMLESYSIRISSNVILIEPVSYFDMLVLEKNAKIIFTDSGGVQKEASWLETPCVLLREETEWPELVKFKWSALVGTHVKKMKKAVTQYLTSPPRFSLLERKNEEDYSSLDIVSIIDKFLVL